MDDQAVFSLNIAFYNSNARSAIFSELVHCNRYDFDFFFRQKSYAYPIFASLQISVCLCFVLFLDAIKFKEVLRKFCLLCKKFNPEKSFPKQNKDIVFGDCFTLYSVFLSERGGGPRFFLLLCYWQNEFFVICYCQNMFGVSCYWTVHCSCYGKIEFILLSVIGKISFMFCYS